MTAQPLMQQDVDAFANGLHDLLKAVLARASKTWSDGLPREERQVLRFDEDGRATVRWEAVRSFAPIRLAAKTIASMPECKALLDVIRGSDGLRREVLVNPIGQAIEGEGADEWFADRIVIELLRQYTRDGTDITLDEGRIADAVAGASSTLKRSAIAVRRTAPLANFTSEIDSVSLLEGITIERLDRGWIERIGSEYGLLPGSPPFDIWELVDWTHAVVIREEVPKPADRQPFPNAVEQVADAADASDVVTSLRLLKPGAVDFVFQMTEADGPSLQRVDRFRSGFFRPTIYGARYELEIGEAEGLSRILRAYVGRTAGGSFEVAVRRFNLTQGRLLPEDRLIDSWVGLEALYLSPSERSELGYRLAMRVSRFLGDSPDERNRLSALVKSSYDARSKVVHGDRSSAARFSELPELTSDTEGLLRASLRRILDTGRPLNPKDLDAHILRGI